MRAFVMAWEEKESGWGVRPDGWSLHVSADDYGDYLKRYWALVPDPLPMEYSRPVDEVVLRQVEIADDHPLARRLAIEKSLRINHYTDERRALDALANIKWPDG